jgi:MFS family permease
LIFTVAAAIFGIPSGRLSGKIVRKALMVLALSFYLAHSLSQLTVAN